MMRLKKKTAKGSTYEVSGPFWETAAAAIADGRIKAKSLDEFVEQLITSELVSAVRSKANPPADLDPVGDQVVTVVTSIVGPCGRFILPLEPEVAAEFHRSAKILSADPSELLATVAVSRIGEVIEAAARRKKAGRRRK